MLVEKTYRYEGSQRPGWGPALFASLLEKAYRNLLEQTVPERLTRQLMRVADREAEQVRQAAESAA